MCCTQNPQDYKHRIERAQRTRKAPLTQTMFQTRLNFDQKSTGEAIQRNDFKTALTHNAIPSDETKWHESPGSGCGNRTKSNATRGAFVLCLLECEWRMYVYCSCIRIVACHSTHAESNEYARRRGDRTYRTYVRMEWKENDEKQQRKYEYKTHKRIHTENLLRFSEF